MANLSRIMLFTTDVKRLADFYGEALGMRKLPGGSDEWQVLEGEGAQIALHAIPAEYAKGIHIAAPPEPRSTLPTKLCFGVDDPLATRQALLAKGAQMFEPKEIGGAPFCDGTDPDGNMLQFYPKDGPY